jgi:hypothetical protein
MANPQKGEVGFEVGAASYVFKLGTYAQAVLERRVKMPGPKFFKRPADEWGVDDTLSVFWAGLYRQHKLTEEQAADLIDELGATRVQEILFEALKLANPEAGKANGDPQNQGADGTGTAS